MKRDQIITKPIKSSFFSCEKDVETILKKLFISSQPYSNQLKKLLVINTKDCLDDSNQNYLKIAENTTLKEIMEGKYIVLTPKLKLKEHEDVKSYIRISFSDFTSTSNPEYRDCNISFDVICHADYWELYDYQLRPFKILGILDGILDGCKLSGIGTLQFLTCSDLPINEDFSGFSLVYEATHGNDDKLPSEV